MLESTSSSLLDVLAGEDRAALLSRARSLRVRKGQFVVARGEVARDVFIVQEGRLEGILYGADGREVFLRGLTRGQVFGELAAIDDELRSASIVAATDARLLAIQRDAFRQLLASSPNAADWLIRRLTAQVRSLTNRVFELSTLRVQARLHCELVRLARAGGGTPPVVEPAPTHAELANRIGSHREAVTRELNALARRHILRIARGRLEFLDLDALEEELSRSLRAPVEEDGGW